MAESGVSIEFGNLYDQPSHNPIGIVPQKNFKHVHGYLGMVINGRGLPGMGYYSENEVCFNLWIDVFVCIRRHILNPGHICTFDDGEMRPAIAFEIQPRSCISVSRVKGVAGVGPRNSDWQGVIFDYADYKAAFLSFRQLFLEEIAKLAPAQLEYWTEKISAYK